MTSAIAESLQELQRGSRDLEQSLDVYGTADDTAAFRERQHDSLQHLQRLAQTIRADLDAAERNGERRSAVNRLRRQFQAELRNLQSNARGIERAEQKTLTAIKRSLDQHGDSPIAQSNEGAHMQQSAQQLAEQLDIHTADDMRSRLDQMHDIEEGVSQLAEMVHDIAVMVDEQQDDVDRIQNNAASIRDKNVQAEEQVDKSADLQRKARKKQCMMLFVLLLIAGVVAAIVLGVSL